MLEAEFLNVKPMITWDNINSKHSFEEKLSNLENKLITASLKIFFLVLRYNRLRNKKVDKLTFMWKIPNEKVFCI